MSKAMPSMQAVIIENPGKADVLRLVRRPIPNPEPGQVLVRVAAAGLNRADILQRQGKYPPPPGASLDIPGLEIAGTVQALGHGCARYKQGDRVMAILSGGGYAEYVTVMENHCLPVPPSIPLGDAAALPEAIFTVWANLFVAAQVRPGEKVLIHGGSSGIGSMAILMLRAHGAIPIITAGNAEKCGWCLSLGAARAIDYHEEDFTQATRDFTQGLGVDAILDMVGGDYLSRNLDALANHGRLVWIATLQGVKGEIDIRTIMRRRALITGTTLRGRSDAEKAALAHDIERQVMPWLHSGAIKPLIYKRFPIKEAAVAHKTMESGHHHGKIVLETGA